MYDLFPIFLTFAVTTTPIPGRRADMDNPPLFLPRHSIHPNIFSGGDYGPEIPEACRCRKKPGWWRGVIIPDTAGNIWGDRASDPVKLTDKILGG